MQVELPCHNIGHTVRYDYQHRPKYSKPRLIESSERVTMREPRIRTSTFGQMPHKSISTNPQVVTVVTNTGNDRLSPITHTHRHYVARDLSNHRNSFYSIDSLLYTTNSDSSMQSLHDKLVPVRSIKNDHDRYSVSSSSISRSEKLLPSDFNTNNFYRSRFHPKVFTDKRNRAYIEMKLDVHPHKPDNIQTSVNDTDLIVHAIGTQFYEQITLPSNIDFSTLKFFYQHDGYLYITIKLLDEHSSFKYM
jgi:hypothetical protein